jgi:hypothetical protein
MVVLTGYLDDSGGVDATSDACAIAGYVGTESSWKLFETLWQKALDDHGAPYLHMREFTASKPPFDWQETKRRSFISALTSVIKASGLYCVGEVVRLTDTRRFNEERGLTLEPFPLAIYGCMMSLYMRDPLAKYEIWIDKISKPQKKIRQAKDYAGSSPYDDVSLNIKITPLSGGMSFRNVLPMQAADFAAWEILKYNRARDTRANKPPDKRQSYTLLWDASEVNGRLWNDEWFRKFDAYRGSNWPR